MRNVRLLWVLAVGLWLGAGVRAEVAAETVELAVDWPSHVAEQDPHWDRLPQWWFEAPFVGNGLMGTMVFQNAPNQLTIQVGRGDVADHRQASGKFSMNSVLPDSSRLPIGHFILQTRVQMTGCDLKVDLYNAEIVGTVQTKTGDIDLRVYVHSEKMLLVVEADGGQLVPFRIFWVPEKAFCPRTRGGRLSNSHDRDGYVENPDPVVDTREDIETCRQDLIAGGQTGTAWTFKKHGTRQTVLASVGHSFPESTALDEAVGVIESVMNESSESLTASHRPWWNEFYKRGFISLPDQRLNSFYWLQNYKVAGATKGGYAIADNQGPWLQFSGWPACWWNLNVQLTYSHLPTANQPELIRGFTELLYKNRENLANNVPERMKDAMAINVVSGQDLISKVHDPKEKKNQAIGNLLWAVHNAYMGYRHTMDDELLQEKILPLLKPAVNFYFYIMIEGEDGRLHLPNTNSPEFGRSGTTNCNYDLALLRWGCQALIDSHHRLGIDDPMMAKWQDVLDRLVDYPVDETGYRVGTDQAFDHSHRHYSHLLMVYPLYLVTADDPANVELIKKSIDHWQSFPEGLSGYSFTGSASMYASLGLGDIAEGRMQAFMDDKVLPNTFYAEAKNPVFETPPAGARSLQDILIQSWGDTIRVFPAMPKIWKDAAFADLSAEGAFDVSAVYKGGQTQFVKVVSRAGEPCKVATGITGETKVLGVPADRVTDLGDGVFDIDLKKGETVVIARPDAELKIAPVKKSKYHSWLWGLNVRGQTEAKVVYR